MTWKKAASILILLLLCIQQLAVPINTAYAETTIELLESKEEITKSAFEFEKLLPLNQMFNTERTKEENQLFTIDKDEVTVVEKNSNVTIEAKAKIKTHRISVEVSSEISLIENDEFEIIHISENKGQTTHVLEFYEEKDHFTVEVQIQDNGWVMIADEKQTLHVVAAHFDTEVESRESGRNGARVSHDLVSSWALFQLVWNSNVYTSMSLTANFEVAANQSLNTRTAGLMINGNNFTITGHFDLGWATGTTVVFSRIGATSVSFNGGHLEILQGSRQVIISGSSSVSSIDLTNASHTYTTLNENYSLINTGSLNVMGAFTIRSNLGAGLLTYNPIQIGSFVTSGIITVSGGMSFKSANSKAPVFWTSNGSIRNLMGRFGIFNLGNTTNVANHSWSNDFTASIVNGQASSPQHPSFNNQTFDFHNIYWILTTGGSDGGWVEPPEEPTIGMVTVNYVDNDGNRLADSETLTGTVGDSYTTSPKTIENYRVRSDNPSNASGTFTSEDIIVDYIYDEIGNIIVYYRDTQGNDLHDPFSITGIVGSTYETDDLMFEGYNLIETPNNATGEISSDTIEVFYLYEVDLEGAEAVLTVEFVNELNQVLSGYTIMVDSQVGNEIDLTKEELVIKQLAYLENAGYEIVERPENETAVVINNTEVSVQYKLQGVLSLSSAPNTIDFGVLTYNATTKRVDEPAIDQPLIVTDTRADSVSGWTLTASLTQPMVNADQQELVNVLRYVYRGQETILDTNAQTVFLNTEGSAGSFDISNSWGNQTGSDGLKLQIGSTDTIHTGNYSGVITWKVMAGQP